MVHNNRPGQVTIDLDQGLGEGSSDLGEGLACGCSSDHRRLVINGRASCSTTFDLTATTL
jgi:hypothetical protein